VQRGGYTLGSRSDVNGSGWSWNWARGRWRTGSRLTSGGRWAPIKTPIGELFHVGYTIEGVWKLMRRHGYALDMNPVEGIWSLLKRAIANFAAADLDGLVRIIKRKLKKIQYRPHLINGCLATTGLRIEPW
jgi:hypothetical protein